MVWLILLHVLVWGLLYVILIDESKWVRILCGLGILCIVAYCIWGHPDFIYANPQKARTIHIICEIIGLILILPVLNKKKE